MQNLMTLSYLSSDNLEGFPFPEEIKGLVGLISLEKPIWSVSGFPLNGAYYSLIGKNLYLEPSPNGVGKVEKQDFTGEVLAATTIINPNKDLPNYIVGFKLIFFKGSLSEVLFHVLKEIS